MRKIIIFILLILVLIVVAYSAILIFVNMKGKEIIKAHIKKRFGLEARVEAVSLRAPFNLEIKNFECGDVSFKRANISLGVFNPFIPRFNISSLFINELKAKITRQKDKVIFIPILAGKVSKNTAASEGKNDISSPHNNKRVHFKINNFFLRNASVIFSDLTTQEPVQLVLKDIDLKIRDFNYPQLTKFYVNLNASLAGGSIEMKDAVDARGWIDYFNRDMDCSLYLKNINYLAFNPYYPSFWKADSLGVREALLSLQSSLKSQNNDLIIDCLLSLEKIEFKDDIEDSSRINTLKTIIALFSGKDGKPRWHFKLKTLMDSPTLDFSSLQDNFKKVVKWDLGNIFNQVIKRATTTITERVKDAGETTVDNAVDTIKDVVDTITDIFKKQK
jgi:hypothetical protein